jgi:hypothetical protein
MVKKVKTRCKRILETYGRRYSNIVDKMSAALSCEVYKLCTDWKINFKPQVLWGLGFTCAYSYRGKEIHYNMGVSFDKTIEVMDLDLYKAMDTYVGLKSHTPIGNLVKDWDCSLLYEEEATLIKIGTGFKDDPKGKELSLVACNEDLIFERGFSYVGPVYKDRALEVAEVYQNNPEQGKWAVTGLGYFGPNELEKLTKS